MRSRPRSTDRAVAIAMRSSGNASGSRSSIPIWAENRSRRSATLRPIGPKTEIGVQPSGRPSIGTTPGDGRKPTTPQIAAGIRNDPPVSEPVQTGSMSHASATAEPPEEPPALSRGSKGFPVAPHTRLRVFAPAPNSGTLVLQRMIAPALRTSATMAASFRLGNHLACAYSESKTVPASTRSTRNSLFYKIELGNKRKVEVLPEVRDGKWYQSFE